MNMREWCQTVANDDLLAKFNIAGFPEYESRWSVMYLNTR